MGIGMGSVSTHSRPKAAGRITSYFFVWSPVSTHSRPKAAGQSKGIIMVDAQNVSTHSRPKAAGRTAFQQVLTDWFQHTAARRRLGSTRYISRAPSEIGFNTQPPEGGWSIKSAA